MERYLQITREAIINSQTTPRLSLESKERMNLRQAKMMIRCGSPKLARKGRGLLRRTQNRRFIRLLKEKFGYFKPTTLDAEGARLLAARRAWFEKLVEEKRNNDQ